MEFFFLNEQSLNENIFKKKRIYYISKDQHDKGDTIKITNGVDTIKNAIIIFMKHSHSVPYEVEEIIANQKFKNDFESKEVYLYTFSGKDFRKKHVEFESKSKVEVKNIEAITLKDLCEKNNLTYKFLDYDGIHRKLKSTRKKLETKLKSIIGTYGKSVSASIKIENGSLDIDDVIFGKNWIEIYLANTNLWDYGKEENFNPRNDDGDKNEKFYTIMNEICSKLEKEINNEKIKVYHDGDWDTGFISLSFKY